MFPFLAPTMFNIYVGDIPDTESLQFGYADDLAIACQSPQFEVLEGTVSRDVERLRGFFDTWYLRMNQTKTVSTAFHLNNQKAAYKLRVRDTVRGEMLPSEKHPKYLGVYLDRALTYNTHCEHTAQKLRGRSSIIKKLAGTSHNLGSKSDCITHLCSGIVL